MNGIDLTASEKEVLSVKYASPRISEIAEHERPVIFKTLLFRIHTITGWKLPDDDYFLKILSDEFSKFLSEKYRDLNPDEITYAFRNYGTTVKDWGKSMNLSLIDEPITKYLSVRQCLSEIEERKAIPEEVKQISPPLNDDELIENVKSVFSKTKIVGLIPVKVYDVLIDREEIVLDNDQKLAIRKRVEARLNREAFEGDTELKMMGKRDYEIRTRNECKKQAVADYFLKQEAIDNF